MKTLSLFAVVVFAASPVVAADVVVSDTHICCGQCEKGIKAALGKAKGVSDVTVDKAKKSVSFKATDRKAVGGGIRALFRAGFAGKIKVDGKPLRRRKKATKKKAGPKVDTAVLRGVHNCCPGCAKAIAGALKGVDGIEDVTCKKRTVKVTGKGIDVRAAVAALRKAGFAARYGTRKKKPKKKD